MGIIFSVNDFTAELTWAEQTIIDTFFDSLKWDDMSDEGPTVSLVTYGNLMELVDNKNRWIYKGSVTTPPCAKSVYWNVLSTIYPISKKHVEMFKKQLDRGEEGKLDEYGNWREIQEIDGQEVMYVETKIQEEEEVDPMYRAIVIACISFAFTTFITILIIVVMCLNKKEERATAQVIPLRDYKPAPSTARDENIDFSPAPTKTQAEMNKV